MPASAKKTKKDRLTRHFVDSTINVLKYLSNAYNFCRGIFIQEMCAIILLMVI